MAVASLALVLSLPGTALAAPGDLDQAFGGDGRVLTGFGSDSDESYDVASTPDGRLVAVGATVADTTAGDFAVARYNPDGSLDTRFGGDGRVTTDISGEGQWDTAYGVAVQPDGKIVVVGSSWIEFENCCWFTVVRYNPDGSLDTGFGGGDGKVLTDFDGGPNEAYEVALRSDGRIVAAGTSGGRFAVARYNADGSPDTSFGGDGEVTTDPGPAPDEGGTGRTLTLQPDGKIVAGGDVGTTRFDFALIRYNENGSLDTTFSGDGIVRTDFGDYEAVEALAVQPDGKIVAAGELYGSAMARYNPDGSLDTGFGGDGRVDPPAGGRDMVLQSDGRIVLAGGSVPGDFAVVRHNPDGSLDTGFGGDGLVTTDFGGSDRARGVVLQDDGKIVAAGSGGPNGDFALARYEGGGTTPPPPPPANANLSVTKSGPGQLTLGNRATYTVQVTNASDSTASATGITLSDTVSGAGATVVSATTISGSCTTTFTSANCTLSSLLPGASATVTVTVEPRATGTVTDRATVDAMEDDPVPGNNTATATTTVNNSRGCTIIGTSAGETLVGSGGNDVICGLGGNDTIRGGNGSDTLYGDVGNDNVDGGFGNDTLYGGSGSDSLTGYYGSDRLDTVDGVSGNDTANGGPNSDTCTTDPGDNRVSCP
ncbi:calcium-binding protein [Streptomyces sp. Tu 2975]|uniref:calcium-binding protein n=1 Tax=Streptomyces sp. Tu 2975 TaxID=2676871 RepID=UPI001FC9351B|nr:calcium-binding protein [Streptomyces sp. Tu 2975]